MVRYRFIRLRYGSAEPRKELPLKAALIIVAALLVAACTRGYGVDPLLIPPEANADANVES